MGHRAKPYSSRASASGQGAANVRRVANPSPDDGLNSRSDRSARVLDAAPGPMHPRARRRCSRRSTPGGPTRDGCTARDDRPAAARPGPRGARRRPGGAPAPRSASRPTARPRSAGVDGLRYAARRRGARGGRLRGRALRGPRPRAPRRRRRGDPTALRRGRRRRAGRVDLDAWRRAWPRPGTVAAALQHANGEVGHDAAARGGPRRPAALPACRSCVDAPGVAGPDARSPTAYDVLVGDARSWGGPGGLGLARRPGAHPVALPGRDRPGRGAQRTDPAHARGCRWCWPRPRRGSRPRRPARPRRPRRSRARRPGPGGRRRGPGRRRRGRPGRTGSPTS